MSRSTISTFQLFALFPDEESAKLIRDEFAPLTCNMFTSDRLSGERRKSEVKTVRFYRIVKPLSSFRFLIELFAEDKTFVRTDANTFVSKSNAEKYVQAVYPKCSEVNFNKQVSGV